MRAVVDLPDGTREDRDVDSDEILGPVVIPAYYEAGPLAGKALNASSGCDYHCIIVASARQTAMNGVSRLGVDLHSEFDFVVVDFFSANLCFNRLS
jgi:hypothetical protein